MDNTALLIILAVFTGVAAIALIIQAAVMVGLYKTSRSMREKVEMWTPKIHALMDSSLAAIEENKAKIGEITAKTSQILDSASRQVKVVENLLADFSGRAHNQLDRAELVLDDAMGRVQQTVSLVHGGILKPIREINGMAAGIRAAIQYFARGRRPSPDRATVDEEMFI
ncbi:MAG TPA: hypothetical protein VH639_00560 [Bryobacteraceae bacterium]|jgi:signal transduction histidine kinase